MSALNRRHLLIGLSCAAFAPTTAHACSRMFWPDTGRGAYIGRNMDWFEDCRSNMWMLPSGMARTGVTPENPLTWTSRYGSFVITGYDSVVVDGVNEAGLAGHLLFLPEASTAPREPGRKGLSLSAWLVYYLDMFATVAEAVADTEKNPYQLRMAVEPGSGKAATIHLALNDKGGDSAIVEVVDGRIRIYHDRRYVVMTNQPTYDKQLLNLAKYEGFGGTERLPGTHEASDRFVRAAYYSRHLPRPASEREAVASVMSVMRNVSAPFGLADAARPNISTTMWRTVYSLDAGIVYYDSTLSANTFWVSYGKLDVTPRSGVRKLTVVDNFDLIGDVSDRFVPAAMFPMLPANE